MIDFKDIGSLSKPLKRLIEVVVEGIGRISRPILPREIADGLSTVLEQFSSIAEELRE